jgi:hypothetical protein
MKVVYDPSPARLAVQRSCERCCTIVELEPIDTKVFDDQREGLSFEWHCPKCGARQRMGERDLLRVWCNGAKRSLATPHDIIIAGNGNTMNRKSGDDIIDAERELERATHTYLRSHGWNYTSETPGCLWLWKKTTPKGETILVETDTALSMQRHSCAIRGNEW